MSNTCWAGPKQGIGIENLRIWLKQDDHESSLATYLRAGLSRNAAVMAVGLPPTASAAMSKLISRSPELLQAWLEGRRSTKNPSFDARRIDIEDFRLKISAEGKSRTDLLSQYECGASTINKMWNLCDQTFRDRFISIYYRDSPNYLARVSRARFLAARRLEWASRSSAEQDSAISIHAPPTQQDGSFASGASQASVILKQGLPPITPSEVPGDEPRLSSSHPPRYQESEIDEMHIDRLLEDHRRTWDYGGGADVNEYTC